MRIRDRRVLGVVAVALLGGLVSARPAGAASITVTDTAPLSGAEISGLLSVPRFDPALGTLTGVSYSITGAIASLLGIQNDSAGVISPSAFTLVDFYVDSAALSLAGGPDFDVLASTGAVTLGIGESALFPVTSQTTITGSEAPFAASFLLPGTVDLSFFTVTSFGASSTGGDVTISQATDAGISFSLTYEFVPVPEPTSLGMLALGLVGIARARPRTPRR